MYAAAIPIFIRRLVEHQHVTVFGDGKQTRDLIFVGDVVRANLIAAEHPAAAGQVFNVSTGRESSILDLLDILEGLCPGAPNRQFAPPRPGDIYKSLGSPVKAQDVLGFCAQTSLLDGLRATLDWMQ